MFPPKDNLKSNRKSVDDTQWKKMLVAAVMVFATKAAAVGLFLGKSLLILIITHSATSVSSAIEIHK